jgi:group II intron reverse transcriptase/maturase
MNGSGKSDSPVVPKKSPNEAAVRAEEVMEGRGLTKRNSPKHDGPRTQGRIGLHNALERVRRAATKDRKAKLTALHHHVSDVERLRKAYAETRRDAAAGIDEVTWEDYGKDLEANLHDLSERLKRGVYRAKPVKRVFIPKADGRQRPLGIPTLEDKIVQRAVVEVMNAIYEPEFLGFSYGFRPRRAQHNALDALAVGIEKKRVGWVLDADIRSFFDTLKHEWLVKFVEHRIGDRRIVRLIQKWLNAGVLEDGKRIVAEEGTVQGGSISPLLANLYLHYVFDLWVHQWRRTRARGDVVVVRYADDFVMGFQHRHEAEQFQKELHERLAKFGLALHPEKTRLIEFGCRAAARRKSHGEPKLATFNFLGFTHLCAKTLKGGYRLQRKTMRKKLGAKLREVKAELRRRMHTPIPAQGHYLSTVLQGHYRYYGVPLNAQRLGAFQLAVARLWERSLKRRSQRNRLTRPRLNRLFARWLPRPRLHHPFPSERLRVIT